MIDSLRRLFPFRFHSEVTSGVQVTVEARKVAAGDFYSDAVAFLENVARSPEIDMVFIYFTGY